MAAFMADGASAKPLCQRISGLSTKKIRPLLPFIEIETRLTYTGEAEFESIEPWWLRKRKPMIQLVNVSKSYDGIRNAVDDLTLDIRGGEIFGFLGPNGAGKTTTLKLITGLLSLDQGSISINGYDIERSPIEAKRQFAFVPDNPDVFLRLKGIEYLRFIADVYGVGRQEREERVQSLTMRFGINDALNQMIKTYSHGMKQKLILTGALLHDPHAWILDEPMTGLDPASSFQLKQLMREHVDAGKIVLFSTHILEVAEKICDRLCVIDNGKLLFVGSMAELKSRYAEDTSLESLFFRLVNNPEEDAALRGTDWGKEG